MIEIKISGETHQDAVNAFMGLANLIAIGVNVTQAQAAQQVEQQPAPEAVTVTTEAPKKAKAKKPEPTPPAQTDIEDVFDDGDVENVESENPIPANLDQLRELVMKVHTKVGAVKGSDIVKKYAPKISGIPVEKYGAIAAELYKALEG